MPRQLPTGVHGDHAHPPVVGTHARDDGRARAEGNQPLQKLAQVALLVKLPVFHTGQEAGLRDVRRDDVRAGAEAAHFFGETGVKAGVKTALIGHHGIDENQRMRSAEAVEKILDKGHLRGGGKVAGIERVKTQAEGLPMRCNGSELRGQIRTNEAVEGGVRGKHGGGKRGALDAHSGKNGHRDAQRAFSYTGKVLYRGNSLHCVSP